MVKYKQTRVAMGVYEIQYHSGKSMFEARVYAEEKIRILGKFDTQAEAEACRKKYRKEHPRAPRNKPKVTKNRVFGCAVVLHKTDLSDNGNAKWLMLCSCGTYYLATESELQSEEVISCGHISVEDYRLALSKSNVEPKFLIHQNNGQANILKSEKKYYVYVDHKYVGSYDTLELARQAEKSYRESHSVNAYTKKASRLAGIVPYKVAEGHHYQSYARKILLGQYNTIDEAIHARNVYFEIFPPKQGPNSLTGNKSGHKYISVTHQAGKVRYQVAMVLAGFKFYGGSFMHLADALNARNKMLQKYMNPFLEQMALDKPMGIKRKVKNGVAYWHVAYFKNHHRVDIGTFESKERAVMARIDYMVRHDIVYRAKKAKAIEVTPKLEQRVKTLKGISFYRQARTGKITGFRAEIMRNHKKKYLGKFDTLEDAAAAYKRAEVDYDRGTSK